MSAYAVPCESRLKEWGASESTIDVYATKEHEERTRYLSGTLSDMQIPAARVRLHVERGTPLRLIRHTATQLSADLIVVGRRAQPNPPETRMYRNILVPIDGSEMSTQGLREAVRLADRLGSRIRLLRRQRRWAVLGIITNALMIPFVGLFIALNHGSPRYLFPAIAIDLYVIANVVVHSRQAHLLSGLDCTGPVATIQRRIDEIVRLRIHFAQWIAMTMVLIWVPVSIVATKAFLGLDLYAVAPGWLFANAAAGLCWLLIVLWFTRRVARGKMARPPQRFLRAIAGENLSSAKTFLDALSDLEQEGSHPI